MSIWNLIILLSITLFLVPYTVMMVREQKPQSDLSIGERFHEETSLTWRGAIADMFRSRPKSPPLYKTYRNAPVTKLPQPIHKGMAVEEAIGKRRSIRNYSKKPLTMPQLSQLLFAAQGVSGSMYGQALRTAPSAGALYPFEIYVVVNDVQGLSKGIYHYAVRDHALEQLKTGDMRREIVSAGLEQDMLGDGDVAFILTAMVDRIRHKYGERGYRYIYIEAGHISQNITLQAVSLGLGSVCVGAFLDEQVNRLVGVDGRSEISIYIHAVGTL